MIKSLNTWRKIIVYGIVSFLIFSLSLTMMIAYNFYVQTINLKDERERQRNDRSGLSGLDCDLNNNASHLVERVDQLRIGYKVGEEKNPHIFLIDVLKIDGCKYIMVHNHIEGDTDLALIHANSCLNCKKENK